MPAPDLNRALERLEPSLPSFLRVTAESLEGDAWAVGGFVRDLLLRRRSYDLDLAVVSGAREAAGKIAAALGGHAFPLDEERETYRVSLGEGAALRTIDISTLRGADVGADLAGRDFTVNAIAARLTTRGLDGIVDPYRGRDDARGKVVRMVSREALQEDPLRLLRAARLAVELDFDVEKETAEAVRAHAGLVIRAAAERQRDELMRIMASDAAARGLRLLDDLGLLGVVVPEIMRAKGVSQPDRYHHYDVFDHSIEAVAVADWLLGQREPEGRTPREMRRAFWEVLGRHGPRGYFDGVVGGQSRLALTKFATLLHDVSKPETKAEDETGRVRFLGHSERGAQVGATICKRLRLGNRETSFVAMLIEEHLRPPQLSQSGAPTDRAIFRFFRSLDDAAVACLVLSLADGAAAAGPRLTRSHWRAHLAYIDYVLERGTVQRQALGDQQGKRHFVSGDRLIQALAIRPGPEIGRLLTAIDEAAATGELRSEEEAIDLAVALRERWRHEGEGEGAGVA